MSEEPRNISFQHPPHGRDTWSGVWQVPSGGAPNPRGEAGTTGHRLPSNPVWSPVLLGAARPPHARCDPCVILPANNAPNLPPHEAAAQAQKLFLRKQGSGSQRRKPDFHSKHNRPQESSMSAESCTVDLRTSRLCCRRVSNPLTKAQPTSRTSPRGSVLSLDCDHVTCQRAQKEPGRADDASQRERLGSCGSGVDGTGTSIHGNGIGASSWWFTTNNAVAALMDN